MNNIELYKKISDDIIQALKNDKVENIENLFSERQEILDIELGNREFVGILKKDGIIEIDEEIQRLLAESIYNVKLEIKKHKQSVQANNSYINSFNKNLNIFYKKV